MAVSVCGSSTPRTAARVAARLLKERNCCLSPTQAEQREAQAELQIGGNTGIANSFAFNLLAGLREPVGEDRAERLAFAFFSARVEILEYRRQEFIPFLELLQAFLLVGGLSPRARAASAFQAVWAPNQAPRRAHDARDQQKKGE